MAMGVFGVSNCTLSIPSPCALVVVDPVNPVLIGIYATALRVEANIQTVIPIGQQMKMGENFRIIMTSLRRHAKKIVGRK